MFSNQSQDFRDENFDDDANEVPNVQNCSEDNIMHQACANCISDNTCHSDDEVNENTTVATLSPLKLFTDKKPTLGSAKKMI